MSKRAEDYANKRFPPNIGEDYIPICGGYEIKESDFNSDRRFGCRIGYEQAEKDLGWHSVEESLPLIDEEVIALSDTATSGKKLPWADRICFAHIVDTNIAVDYNGWNIPGVRYWMPCPKIPEE